MQSIINLKSFLFGCIVVLLLLISSSAHLAEAYESDDDSYGQLLISSVESLRHDGGQTVVEFEGLAQPRATFYRSVQCDVTSECLPLSECTIIQYKAAKSCLTGDRSLNCGASDVEPYVCCPRKLDNVKSCGKSLVTGQFYKGLGSFPYVARIGFKSEFGSI